MIAGYQTVGSAANSRIPEDVRRAFEQAERRAYAEKVEREATMPHDFRYYSGAEPCTAPSEQPVLNDIFNSLDALDCALQNIEAGLVRCGINVNEPCDTRSLGMVPSRSDGFLSVRKELANLVSRAHRAQSHIETLA
jgi:hypothetical protein